MLSSRANSPRLTAVVGRQKAVSARESHGHQELSRVNKVTALLTHNKDRGICFPILFFFLFAGALAIVGPAFAGDKDKDKSVAWKPIQQALLRVDDQPVKNWNVYQENKKGDPLLLQMGNRFLLIEVHERKIFELASAQIERKGVELLWDPAGIPAEPLATSDWIIRDVGFAYRIGARLAAENRLLDLQLPHPMDLRYL